MNTGDYRGQKMALGPLELKLQLFMSRLVWILGPKLGSSEKRAGALNWSHLSSSLHFKIVMCFY